MAKAGYTAITIEVPNADVPRVERALCEWAGLPTSTPNAKEALIGWIRSVVPQQEAEGGAREARETVKPLEGVE